MRGPIDLPTDLRERLAAVRTVGAITGAGVSAGSGIRTYRGAGGLYDDPEEGQSTVEALSHPTLLRDPDRTWRALAGLAREAQGARPGPAHYALAAIEHRTERFVLLTQNVDGLHQAAGSRNVIDIHGGLDTATCTRCERRREIAWAELASLTRAPRCAACGAALRPDAVLFGELLPTDKLERIHDEFGRRTPDLVLVAGTSALFPYIQEPVAIARRRGRLTIEINPEPTELSRIVDRVLRGPANLWLPLVSGALPRTRALPPRPRDRLGRPLPPGSSSELDESGSKNGVALLEAERCFEAHEAFERAWRTETIDEERPFWRALAQLAVAGCHAQRGNPTGAAGVLSRAQDVLSRYPGDHRGIAVSGLVDRATRLVRNSRPWSRRSGDPRRS